MAAYRLDPADGGVSVIYLDFPPRRVKGVGAAASAPTPEAEDDGWFCAEAGRDVHREGGTPSIGWHVGGRWREPGQRAA